MKLIKISKELFYKKKLHPFFWKKNGGEFEFKEDVRKRILEIIDNFSNETETKDHIEDIQLTGSIANFTYTKYSDVDVHLLVNFEKIGEEELVKRALDGECWTWNHKHEVKFKGHDFEIYFQDVDEPHVSSGLYSLKNGSWLKKPKYDPPDIDHRDVERKVKRYSNVISELKRISKKELDEERFKKLNKYSHALLDKIKKYRKDSIKVEGEFGIGNLVFKKLRQDGDIEVLMDIVNCSYDEAFSID